MRKFKLWIYKRLHEYDDYSIKATMCSDIRESIDLYSTPWMIEAIVIYIYLNFKYPKSTIVFTHHRYKK